MRTIQTAAPNADNTETKDATNFPYLPVQIIPLADENGKHKNAFPFPTFVIRYPVFEGWIVGTIVGDGGIAAVSQSFVPDPDHIWTATFADDKTPTAPQS